MNDQPPPHDPSDETPSTDDDRVHEMIFIDPAAGGDTSDTPPGVYVYYASSDAPLYRRDWRFWVVVVIGSALVLALFITFFTFALIVSVIAVAVRLIMLGVARLRG